MNSCIQSSIKECWVVTSACPYLKCLILSGGRTESCSASPRHYYHSHAMWPCARHAHRQGKPSTFMINRQAKLHSKPSVIMKEVNLRDRGDREQCGGRRGQEWRSKGLFWRFEGPVYNRQPSSTQLRAFEVSGSVCGDPGAYKPWLAGETFTPPAAHVVAVILSPSGRRRDSLGLSWSRLHTCLTTSSAFTHGYMCPQVSPVVWRECCMCVCVQGPD